MSGHRQAALALHALSKRDQELILAQLPAADGAKLNEYLLELTALGFDPRPMTVHAPANTVDPQHARIRAASATEMFELLAQEPATLLAQVLSIEAWPFTAELLGMLTPARLALVQDARSSAIVPAPAREQFLVHSLGRALAATPTADHARPAMSAQGLVAAWRRTVGIWIR